MAPKFSEDLEKIADCNSGLSRIGGIEEFGVSVFPRMDALYARSIFVGGIGDFGNLFRFGILKLTGLD